MGVAEVGKIRKARFVADKCDVTNSRHQNHGFFGKLCVYEVGVLMLYYVKVLCDNLKKMENKALCGRKIVTEL